MIDLRDLELLAALARRGHFSRAAEDCGISQPAFSARIRNLEHALGAPLVKRGARFEGFTREGDIALVWARRALADAEGLRQAMAEARGALEGRLMLGVIPTALPFAARLTAPLRARHPLIRPQALSLSSIDIERRLDDFSLDAGLTYLSGETPPGRRMLKLYDERYVLAAPRALAPRAEGFATWAEAAALPLCLLTPDMQNRRIVDSAFAAAGAAPNIAFETNVLTVAIAHVRIGAAAAILPAAHLALLEEARDLARLPLEGPDLRQPVGLVSAGRDPAPPVEEALFRLAADLIDPARE